MVITFYLQNHQGTSFSLKKYFCLGGQPVFQGIFFWLQSVSKLLCMGPRFCPTTMPSWAHSSKTNQSSCAWNPVLFEELRTRALAGFYFIPPRVSLIFTSELTILKLAFQALDLSLGGIFFKKSINQIDPHERRESNNLFIVKLSVPWITIATQPHTTGCCHPLVLRIEQVSTVHGGSDMLPRVWLSARLFAGFQMVTGGSITLKFLLLCLPFPFIFKATSIFNIMNCCYHLLKDTFPRNFLLIKKLLLT